MHAEVTTAAALRVALAVCNGLAAGSACFAALNPETQSLFCDEVDLGGVSLTEIEAAFQDPDHRLLPGLRESLVATLRGSDNVQVVAAVSTVFPETDSALVKAIMLVTLFGFGSMQFGRVSVQGVDRMLLGVDPPVLDRKTAPPGLPPRILWAYVDPIKAYGEFELGQRPEGPALAATTALCAATPGLFYFLTSGGDPQSSQDVVEFLSARDRMKSWGIDLDVPIIHGVVSGTERYSMSAAAETKFDDKQRLPLRYAIAAKRFEWLEPRHARKLAVLTVCKEWAIKLTCSSLRDESFAEQIVESLSQAAELEDESDRALAAILKEQSDTADVAVGFKAAFLLAMYKALTEAGAFPNVLELRLLGLAKKPIAEHAVYDPSNLLASWVVDGIRALQVGCGGRPA